MKTRFAPSPTGFLHIGHALAAITVWDDASRSPDRFLLRIEDIDRTRCKPAYETAIIDDLRWLGLSWTDPVRRQSDHFADYQNILDFLSAERLIYPCFCTRKEIEAEINRAPTAPHGPEGAPYPRSCAPLSDAERHDRIAAGTPYALRLDMSAATARLSTPLLWHDRIKGAQETHPDYLTSVIGDVVLARKDTPASYHLCVTHDDALQEIGLVTRGEDLFFATHIHRLLQFLMGWPVPEYHHHPLLTDQHGRRFAKRDKSLTLREIRARGIAPEDLITRIKHGTIDDLLI